jgi:hypothetical protein
LSSLRSVAGSAASLSAGEGRPLGSVDD